MSGVATPLFVVLLLVETTDIIFAVDSIPAIFAVTQNTFLVYTSNIFAILGLRALYFLLAGVIRTFHYLQLGLAVVLTFVGVKMLMADWYKVPIGLSLAIIAAVLAISVIASWLFPKAEEEEVVQQRDPHHLSAPDASPTPAAADAGDESPSPRERRAD
jgi:tellurite resistance protein TerC